MGRNDVEKALQRLDKLTQEEARMAAAEALTMTRDIDDKVQRVDHKVGSVLECTLHPHQASLKSVLNSYLVRCQGGRSSNQASDQSSQRYGPFVIFQPFTAGHSSLTSLIGNKLRTWIAPPDPSVNYIAASGALHEGTASWCTEGITVADWKTSGSLLWIHGKRTYPITVCIFILANDSWIDSRIWEDHSQVRFPRRFAS